MRGLRGGAFSIRLLWSIFCARFALTALFAPLAGLGLGSKSKSGTKYAAKISALSLPDTCCNIPFLGGWEGRWVCWRAANSFKKNKFYFHIQILCVHHLTIFRKSANVQFTIECAGRVVKKKNAKFLMFHCCVFFFFFSLLCMHAYFQDRWRGRWSEKPHSVQWTSKIYLLLRTDPNTRPFRIKELSSRFGILVYN